MNALTTCESPSPRMLHTWRCSASQVPALAVAFGATDFPAVASALGGEGFRDGNR